jgi:Na+-transporting methylmalonyl-CoA/oxaloacetate decarboxylase gamma subunit
MKDMFISLTNLDFSAIDQKALTIVLAGISVVFMVLISIYLIFRYLIPAILRVIIKKRVRRHGTIETIVKINEIPGDVNAAIALAIYLHLNEIHDEESGVITIKRVSRNYSPWSSKLYSMRNLR